MSEHSAEQVLEGARIIRGCLADLLGGNARAVDEALSVLLVQNPGNTIEKKANHVVALLEQHRETRQWLHTFLRLAGDAAKTYKNYQGIPGYQGVPGYPNSPSSTRYACPSFRCRQIWYLFEVGESIPICEKCKRPFEQVLEEYRCPEGDYTWYSFAKDTPIPQCPTHRRY